MHEAGAFEAKNTPGGRPDRVHGDEGGAAIEAASGTVAARGGHLPAPWHLATTIAHRTRRGTA